MKIGDLIRVNVKVEIEEYIPEYESFKIAFRFPNGHYMMWYIPVFIGNFGIYSKDKQYTMPGDYLPRHHPDYYEYIDEMKSITLIEEEPYRIIVTPDFQRTGKYLLVPKDNKSLETIHKTAEIAAEEWLAEVCESMESTEVAGELLEGRVVRIFYISEGANHIKDGDSLDYRNAISLSNFHAKRDGFVVIHDEETNIEYKLPLSVVEVKPA